MGYCLKDCLVIGVSSRALFDLSYETAFSKQRDFSLISNIRSSMRMTFLSRGRALRL